MFVPGPGTRKSLIALLLLAGTFAAGAQQPALTVLGKVKTPDVTRPTGVTPDTTTDVTTTGGTSGVVPVFSGTSSIINSNLFYSSGRLGLGIAPSATLDVSGSAYFRGSTTLIATAPATSSSGHSSNPLLFQASSYNSSSKAVVNPFFEMRSEAASNNTSSPGATLNLLYGVGTAAPAETGFYVGSNGVLHFASAQTFPITQGPQGPAGPAGPTGPKGATGPAGPQGPAGTIQLPYAGYYSEDSYPVFEIRNNGVSTSTGTADGIAGYGGNSGTSQSFNYGGAGVTGYGGVAETTSSSTYVYAGPGVSGTGGTGNPSSLYTGGGDGGDFQGGTGGGDSTHGGSGVSATGGSPNGDGIDAYSQGNGDAGFFSGPVDVTGTFTNIAGAMKIDDPSDPANKYLYQSLVVSPDMMNIYNGNVTTDGSGQAVVELPSWFESLNSDFRYQLTTIGSFSRAMIASEISNGKFVIQTEKGNVKVSWQVTGVRQDAWANAHRLPTEVEKSDAEKGHYIHPELYGHAAEPDVHQATHNLPALRKAAVPSQQ